MAKLVSNNRLQYLDANGDPYSGAKLFTYQAGSSTKEATYSDSAGSTPNTNPIVLDSDGRTPNQVFLTEGQSYKFVLAPSGDTDPPASPILTDDNITGINDTTTTVDQWVASGLTPTYVSATSFTLAGDQTTEFHVGRRIKTTNSGGTVYSYISASAYTSLTTITVVNDSGTLDAGLSAVSYGILTKNNAAIPKLVTDNYSDDSVTLGKMAAGTAGHLISYDSSGDPQTETYLKWYKHSSSPIDLTNSGANDTASWTFSSIPSSVIMAILVLDSPSLSGTDQIVMLLGDSGGDETTGYDGGSKLVNAVAGNWVANSTYFALTNSAAASDQIDVIKANLIELSGNAWAYDFTGSNTTNTDIEIGSGVKTLSAELTRITIKSSGSNTFDGGTAELYLYGNADV